MNGERPPIPGWVTPAYRELMNACWAQEPEARPTFEQVVATMGSMDLIGASVDRNAVAAYQRKVLRANGR
jgi:hypothetical protein